MPRACTTGWLQTYVEHQRHTEAPKIFHFWTGVATVAGALRRKVWTEHYAYQYTPNFYIILVAPPGVASKSTSMRLGLSLLKNIKDVHFGPQSLTWQALLDALKDAQQTFRIPDTGESLSACCVTLGASELGTFMRPENREYIDQLISLYDGQKETLSRRTRGDETILVNPWLNLIACTTPSWLKDTFPDVMVGGGLASRILFVYEDRKQQLIPYPELLVQDKNYVNEEKCLIHDLLEIAKIAGPYKITEEAYSWGKDWYAKLHNGSRPAHLTGDRFAGYLSRKQAHVHKLAIVLAASSRDERILERSDLEAAEAHITLLEKNMQKVFDAIGVSQGAKVNNEIINMIKHVGAEVSYKQLYRVFMKTVDGQTFKNAIMTAVEMGILSREARQGGDWMLKYTGPRE